MKYYIYQQHESCGDTRFTLMGTALDQPTAENIVDQLDKQDPTGTYFWEIGYDA
jgi:hypothetical protein